LKSLKTTYESLRLRINYLELLRNYLVCIGQIIVQAFSDPFSSSRRGQSVPATAAGRPCRQSPRARRGAAGPEAHAGRAGSRGPTCAGQSMGRPGRGARRELHLLPPANPAGGRRWEWRGGTRRGERGELGLRSLPSEARAVADLSPHARAAGYDPCMRGVFSFVFICIFVLNKNELLPLGTGSFPFVVCGHNAAWFLFIGCS
jgi:hypothetical protein